MPVDLLPLYRAKPGTSGHVAGPGEYRWSSYRCNALGVPDALLTPHNLYLQPGSPGIQRQRTYPALFERVIDAGSLAAIREATDKAWVLGKERCCLEIGELLQRQATPGVRGGDRKPLQ